MTLEQDAKQMGLTKAQTAFAKRMGASTILGLRTVEKNTRGMSEQEINALKDWPVGEYPDWKRPKR